MPRSTLETVSRSRLHHRTYQVSDLDATRILKPQFFKIAPLKASRGGRSRAVIGFDTEAERGRPFMLQFNASGDAGDTQIIDLPETENAALNAFSFWIHDNCRSKTTEYIIVGWNLAYEWTQLFADLPRERATLNEFDFIHELRDGGELVARYNVHVFNAKRYSAIWTRLGIACIESCTPENHRCGSKRRVRVIDGMAFYVTSLDKAGEMLGLGRKIDKPAKFTRAAAQTPHFREYAKQDAYLTRRIGEQIVAMHDEFNVTQTISAPHFASKVYKRHFLDEEIRLPDIALEQAGLSSYHGGKNGYYLGGPHHLANVYAFDITSAYPEAMRAIPDPVHSTFDFVGEYRRGLHALWCVSGTLHPCRYGVLYEHHGTIRRNGGDVDSVWVTSYELDTMIEHGEITLTDCYGFVMNGPSGGSLVDYVDRFFEMKRTTEGAARAAAKLFLNSLYGKFFQKQPLGIVGYQEIGTDETVFVRTDPNQDYDWQAGGLYHPPIASLITGFVRAKIHGLEHKYDAIMTSTDGFFAMRAPDPEDIGKDLGKLTVERGDLSIWRERLYAFVSHKPKPCVQCGGTGRFNDDDCGSCGATGKEHKFALHGFRGNLRALMRIPLTVGSFSYRAQQMVTIRLSMHDLGTDRRRYEPGEFAMLDFTLHLDGAAMPP